ncbi:MAG: TRAP transporter small permease subunit [Myxococcota bacterium]
MSIDNTTTRFVGRALAQIDTYTEPSRYRAQARWVWAHLLDLGFVLLLVSTGAVIVLEDIGRLADRALALFERIFVAVALLAMTLLVFDEYLQRELWFALAGDVDVGWRSVVRAVLSIDGKANLAVLLMVMVGFAGASLATRERQHLAVDGMERCSPCRRRAPCAASRLASAGLCLLRFARASAASVFSDSQDAFEGVHVFPVPRPGDRNASRGGAAGREVRPRLLAASLEAPSARSLAALPWRSLGGRLDRRR